MNKVMLMGRLTKDPDIRYSQGERQMEIARYTLAVDRRRSANSDNAADFIPCVSFDRQAEIAEKYFHKGTKIAILGHLQTGSYTDKDGKRVFTMEVIIESQEFAESAAANRRIVGSQAQADTAPAGPAEPSEPACGGYNPETDHDFGDAELPFS